MFAEFGRGHRGKRIVSQEGARKEIQRCTMFEPTCPANLPQGFVPRLEFHNLDKASNKLTQSARVNMAPPKQYQIHKRSEINTYMGQQNGGDGCKWERKAEQHGVRHPMPPLEPGFNSRKKKKVEEMMQDRERHRVYTFQGEPDPKRDNAVFIHRIGREVVGELTSSRLVQKLPKPPLDRDGYCSSNPILLGYEEFVFKSSRGCGTAKPTFHNGNPVFPSTESTENKSPMVCACVFDPINHTFQHHPSDFDEKTDVRQHHQHKETHARRHQEAAKEKLPSGRDTARFRSRAPVCVSQIKF